MKKQKDEISSMLTFSKALRDTVEERNGGGMKKKLSCGLILTDGTQFLSAKPTGGNNRDIPKGMREKGESRLDTVIREVMEETNYDISSYRAQIQPVGEFPYTPEKDIYIFLLKVILLPAPESFKCESMYFDGKKYKPEVGNFKYVTLKQIDRFKKPMQIAIVKAMEMCKD
jgi:8-oxo-dGTP pyrophosphatase MutT (NUDIX family)